MKAAGKTNRKGFGWKGRNEETTVRLKTDILWGTSIYFLKKSEKRWGIVLKSGGQWCKVVNVR